MSLPVIVRPQAEKDIEQVFNELEQAVPGMGRRFSANLQEVFDRIETMPESYAVVWGEVRAVRLKHFRYVLYYIPFLDRVEVLAVLHGARDPSTWQSRT